GEALGSAGARVALAARPEGELAEAVGTVGGPGGGARGWALDRGGDVRGAFNCCRAVLPGMVGRRRGRVVNIGSMVGARDEPYVSAYACAKAAYFRLTGTLAAETAGHGVTVLCVSPGLVRTRMVEEVLLGAAVRRVRPQIPPVPPEEYTPAERIGELLARIAAGDADPLSGRFLHAEDDLDELLADAGRAGAPRTRSRRGCGSRRRAEDNPSPDVRAEG